MATEENTTAPEAGANAKQPETTTATAPESTEPQSKTQKLFDTTIGKTGSKRVVYASVADYLKGLAAFVAEAGEEAIGLVPQVTLGLTDKGELDPAIYGEGTGLLPTLALMTTVAKKNNAGEVIEPREVTAIVTYATPDFDATLAVNEGRTWLVDLLEKEANLISLRPLRKKNVDFLTAAKDLPQSLADFWTAASRSRAVDLPESVKKTWQEIRDYLASKLPAFKQLVQANALKRDVFLSALQSAPFALERFERMENRKDAEGNSYSVFERGLQKAIEACKAAELDASWYEAALAGRDELDLTDQAAISEDTGEDDEALDW